MTNIIMAPNIFELYNSNFYLSITLYLSEQTHHNVS